MAAQETWLPPSVRPGPLDDVEIHAREKLKAFREIEKPWFEVLGSEENRNTVQDDFAPILAWHYCLKTLELREYLESHILGLTVWADRARVNLDGRSVVLSTHRFCYQYEEENPFKQAVDGRNVLLYPERGHRAVLDVEVATGTRLRAEGDGSEFVRGWVQCLEDAPAIGADPLELFRNRHAHLLADDSASGTIDKNDAARKANGAACAQFIQTFLEKHGPFPSIDWERDPNEHDAEWQGLGPRVENALIAEGLVPYNPHDPIRDLAAILDTTEAIGEPLRVAFGEAGPFLHYLDKAGLAWDCARTMTDADAGRESLFLEARKYEPERHPRMVYSGMPDSVAEEKRRQAQWDGARIKKTLIWSLILAWWYGRGGVAGTRQQEAGQSVTGHGSVAAPVAQVHGVVASPSAARKVEIDVEERYRGEVQGRTQETVASGASRDAEGDRQEGARSGAGRRRKYKSDLIRVARHFHEVERKSWAETAMAIERFLKQLSQKKRSRFLKTDDIPAPSKGTISNWPKNRKEDWDGGSLDPADT